VQAAGSDEGVAAYLERFVTAGGEQAYQAAVGTEHLAALSEWEQSNERWMELASA